MHKAKWTAGVRGALMVLIPVVAGSSLIAGCNGGESTEPQQRPDQSRTVQQLTGGTVHSKPWFVTTMESVGACSGVLYKSQWVITAAHCFPAGWDADSNGTISTTELATTANGWRGYLRVAWGPNSTGSSDLLYYDADAVYKPVGTFWGTSDNNNDIALVHLPSPGFYPQNLPSSDVANFYHTNGSGQKVLNLDQWSTDTLAATSWVDGCGWASDLTCATGVVTTSATGYFDVGALNNAGIPCSGDSGGPGVWWGGNVWGSGTVGYTVGIIAKGNCNNYGSYTSIYANKSWIEMTAGS